MILPRAWVGGRQTESRRTSGLPLGRTCLSRRRFWLARERMERTLQLRRLFSATIRPAGGSSPVGETLSLAGDDHVYTIVGVARDTHPVDDPAKATPTVYRPYVADVMQRTRSQTYLVLDCGRSCSGADRLQAHHTLTENSVDVAGLAGLDAITQAATAMTRFQTWLVVACAACGAAMAGLAVLGSLEQALTVRRRDAAVMAALGGSPFRLAIVFARDWLLWCLVGCTFGAVAAISVVRRLDVLLRLGPPFVPVTLTAGTMVTLVAGLIVIRCLRSAMRPAYTELR
jgi:hypothetical protein